MLTFSSSKISMHNVRISAPGQAPGPTSPPAPVFTPAMFETGSNISSEGYVVVDADHRAAKGYKVLPPQSSGKFYWEFTSYASAYATETIGIMVPEADPLDFSSDKNWRYRSDGEIYQGRSNAGNLGAYSNGLVGGRTVMMALSLNAIYGNQLLIGYDGQWKKGNPLMNDSYPGFNIGYEGKPWSPSYTITPAGIGYSRKSEFNFGQQPMKFEIPAGFKAGWPA